MDGNRHSDVLATALRNRQAQVAPSRLSTTVTQAAETAISVIRDHGLGPDDLRAIVRFAEEVDIRSSEHRCEWTLLFDVLGLTAAANLQKHPQRPGATPNTLIGPFFRPDAPRKKSGDTLSLDGKGIPLSFHGTVHSVEGALVQGAEIDVWHANQDGLFENQNPDSQPEHNLRGRFSTDDDGAFWFRTVRPGPFQLPSDGPVGRLLTDMGLPIMRPAHLQFRVQAEGYETLVTHVFDRADPNMGADPLLCDHDDLATDFTLDPSDESVSITFSFTLARQNANPL